MISRFLDRVARGPLLLDAAMGTRLIAAGLDLATDDPCLWNLARPEVVLDLHRRDVTAGAEAVFTNTFGANRVWLARFGCEGSVAAINRRAAELAREAVGPDRFVLGSIGPTAVAGSTVCEQAEALCAAGADALVLETFRFEQAIAALGSLGDLPKGVPVLVGLFDWPEPLASTARRLIDAGAAVVGANCFADGTLANRLIDGLHAAGDLLCWLKPATTAPGDATFSHDDFAALAARMATIGIGLLGGCCGTSEVHLHTIRDAWQRDI